MSYEEFLKVKNEYFSKPGPTDNDFAEYTKAYFQWCDSAMKNSTKPIDTRKIIMV